MNRLSVFSLGLLLAALVGCNRTYDPTPEHLVNIYPISQGLERIYEMSETTYASTSGSEALQYLRREVTDGTETDLLDREVFKLWIYDSPDSTDSLGNPVRLWSFSQLWTHYQDEDWVERIEGNIRYILLKRPPVTGTSWNGNLYNAQNVETYRVLNDDTTIVLQGTAYDHCVFVQQVPPRRIGESISPGVPIYIDEYAYEIYAPGIGMIAKYRKYIEAQDGQVLSKSHMLRQEIVSHN